MTRPTFSLGSRVRLPDGRVGTIDNLLHPSIDLGCGCCTDFDYDNPHAAEIRVDGTPADEWVEEYLDKLSPE